MVTSFPDAEPAISPVSGDGRSTVRRARSPAAPAPPWYEAPEFRALAAACRAFTRGGIPPAAARTPAAGARQAAFWTLYELGHVLEELAHRTRSGMAGWCVVRASEHGPGRVVLDIAIEPIPEPSPARSAEGDGATRGAP